MDARSSGDQWEVRKVSSKCFLDVGRSLEDVAEVAEVGFLAAGGDLSQPTVVPSLPVSVRDSPHIV